MVTFNILARSGTRNGLVEMAGYPANRN